ncbi:MAG: hypothetical protein ACLPXZ_19600 [Mycobacterium sp.]
MSKPIRSIAAIAVGCAGSVACATTAAQTTPTSTPDCVGLSICAPPPDAEGNPPCYYSDGWQASGSGAGIEVWYSMSHKIFRNPKR